MHVYDSPTSRNFVGIDCEGARDILQDNGDSEATGVKESASKTLCWLSNRKGESM